MQNIKKIAKYVSSKKILPHSELLKILKSKKGKQFVHGGNIERMSDIFIKNINKNDKGYIEFHSYISDMEPEGYNLRIIPEGVSSTNASQHAIIDLTDNEGVKYKRYAN